MLMRGGPARWRRGYALHRRRFRTDEWGELEPVFDMEHPDVVVEQGTADAVWWQSAGESCSRGRLHSGAVQGEPAARHGAGMGTSYGTEKSELISGIVGRV